MLLYFLLLITFTTSIEVDKFDSLIIYQVMVSTYADGDSNIGYTDGWGPHYDSSKGETETQFYSGDLQGIINNIPKISEMGFNAIWMTPIFDSQHTEQYDTVGYCLQHSSTGYFASDYFNIDPHFGGNEKFKELVKKAHENKLYVILDGVFGHWKMEECDGVVAESPNGKKPKVIFGTDDYYNDKNNDGKLPNYPQADWSQQETIDFYQEVAKYWIENYDIDGWRLDVANEISIGGSPENNKVKYILDAVKEATEKNKAAGKEWGTLGYIVGEIWEGSLETMPKWYGEKEEDSIYSYFDFPNYYVLIENAIENTDGGVKHEQNYLKQIYNNLNNVYPKWAHPNFFLSNHDLVRLGNLIKQHSNFDIDENDYYFKHLSFQLFQMLLPTPITVYYGEEVADLFECLTQKYGDQNPTQCGAYRDNAARNNPTPENQLDAKQKKHRQYISNLLKERRRNPIYYCNAVKNPEHCKQKLETKDDDFFTFELERNYTKPDGTRGYIFIKTYPSSILVHPNIQGTVYEILTGTTYLNYNKPFFNETISPDGTRTPCDAVGGSPACRLKIPTDIGAVVFVGEYNPLITDNSQSSQSDGASNLFMMMLLIFIALMI